MGEWVRVYPMCTLPMTLADCAGGGRLGGGWRSAAAAAVVMVLGGWLPGEQVEERRPEVGGYGTDVEANGLLPSTNEQTAALVVNGGGGRLGAEQGASIRHGDPRHELAAVWIPDRGGDGGDDRPAASRIPALRTAGRPHVRRIAAVAVGFGAAAAAAALRLHNRRLGGVLGRLEGRSSILGALQRLGECRESPVVCERLS